MSFLRRKETNMQTRRTVSRRDTNFQAKHKNKFNAKAHWEQDRGCRPNWCKPDAIIKRQAYQEKDKKGKIAMMSVTAQSIHGS